MTGTAGGFSLGREAGEDGAFRRQESAFRRWVTADGSSGFPAVAERYHLYVCRACPWAHRSIIARGLMGLEAAVGISYVDPIRDARGWRFSGDGYIDAVNGFDFLAEAYRATDPGFDARPSVPALWDTETGVIVNNESGEILRMLSTVFAPLAEHPVTLVPADLEDAIDALNAEIYDGVNNAVYAAGFATGQAVYEREVTNLFDHLDRLDDRLSDRRFLFGEALTETDIRLFTTLVRFDAVYQVHFKCSRRKLTEYAHLWPYAREVYGHGGIGETVAFDEIRAHYYGTHPNINPTGIVAVLPADDWKARPGR